ncbi:MAG: HAD-IIIA family hydrolase [Staphylococcus sp.]|nr:HAD-IIIA family hydrolase [Staphylococcus sp.]
MKNIRLFLTDVDGTLTDGGMYYTADGDVMKKFHARDGMGLQLLQKAGIKVGIITSEDTELVRRRAHKLGLDFLVQGKRDGGKLEACADICESLSISLDEVAYIGDDVNCIGLLSAAGMRACPADAVRQVKNIPGILVMNLRGGEGCVREFADLILKRKEEAGR